jgi:hypothetical protein
MICGFYVVREECGSTLQVQGNGGDPCQWLQDSSPSGLIAPQNSPSKGELLVFEIYP